MLDHSNSCYAMLLRYIALLLHLMTQYCIYSKMLRNYKKINRLEYFILKHWGLYVNYNESKIN